MCMFCGVYYLNFFLLFLNLAKYVILKDNARTLKLICCFNYLTQLASANEVKFVTHIKTRLVSPFNVWALIASSLFPLNPLSMMRTRLQRLVEI